MAIEGPLRELGIHDVFQLLDLSRKTGALRVTSELRHNDGTIYFDNGVVVSAEIRSNPHPLGALLLRTGKITEADLERARDMQERQRDKRRLGEILVALGVITQREVERQIHFQIEEVVFEVMSWNEGYFSFNEQPESKVPTEVSVRIPVEALLMEGARRIDEWSRIENRIPHVGVVPSLAPPPESGGGELDLLPPEWEVLALVDGHRSVRALATELGRSDFEVAKTLFGLESAGVIVLMDPGNAKRPRGGGGAAGAGEGGGAGGVGEEGGASASGAVAELVAKAEQALHAKDLDAARAAAEQAGSMQAHDATIHVLLGRIHLAQGRGSTAAEELRRALRLDPQLAAAHRQLGYALVSMGRFAEAVESWDQWERLASRSPEEEAQRSDVQRAREAARVFAHG
jgi:uncharacterized protein DUF4388/tetratricopeptide repeat protein